VAVTRALAPFGILKKLKSVSTMFRIYQIFTSFTVELVDICFLLKSCQALPLVPTGSMTPNPHYSFWPCARYSLPPTNYISLTALCGLTVFTNLLNT